MPLGIARHRSKKQGLKVLQDGENEIHPIGTPFVLTKLKYVSSLSELWRHVNQFSWAPIGTCVLKAEDSWSRRRPCPGRSGEKKNPKHRISAKLQFSCARARIIVKLGKIFLICIASRETPPFPMSGDAKPRI
jgi:hypothetical protein